MKFVSITILALGLSLVSATEAMAQRAFMFVPGIPGESTVEGFVDWINVLSIRQSAISASRKSIACDLSIVKNIDAAGPALWASAATGATISEIVITVLRNSVPEGGSGGSTIVKLYDIRLTNVRIGGVQATTGATDSSETITLVPQGATLTYYVQSPTGAVRPPVTESFPCQ
jgi:type VI protein secretion system component Hcp